MQRACLVTDLACWSGKLIIKADHAADDMKSSAGHCGPEDGPPGLSVPQVACVFTPRSEHSCQNQQPDETAHLCLIHISPVLCLSSPLEIRVVYSPYSAIVQRLPIHDTCITFNLTGQIKVGAHARVCKRRVLKTVQDKQSLILPAMNYTANVNKLKENLFFHIIQSVSVFISFL